MLHHTVTGSCSFSQREVQTQREIGADLASTDLDFLFVPEGHLITSSSL